jgi:uncharacterized membrane-anchored protein YitT (DUF2179 family)
MLNRLTHELISAFLILIGIFSVAFGLKGFLISSHFIDGGVAGVSMLLSDILEIRLAILLPVINFPFIILGYRHMGKVFALKSVLAILGLSLCLAFVPFPDVTPDRLLTAVFGGLFIGAGIGLTIRGGAVLDGTDIAALLISRTSAILKVGDVILIFNILIFTVAAIHLGIEPALYSVLTYLSASKTVNFLIHGIEEYTAIIIVSQASETIRQKIIQELKRSVTVYKGRGGLSDTEQNILYCVVTRLEIGQIKAVVREADTNAFVVVHPLADAEGGVLKKPMLHQS